MSTLRHTEIMFMYRDGGDIMCVIVGVALDLLRFTPGRRFSMKKAVEYRVREFGQQLERAMRWGELDDALCGTRRSASH